MAKKKMRKTTKRKKTTRKFVRRGQTKPRKRTYKGKTGLYYTKAGKVHRVDRSKDSKIKAKHNRSPKSPSWRGDVKGKRI